jgi:ribosome-binding protein aMBF1 (putative translation factor)
MDRTYDESAANIDSGLRDAPELIANESREEFGGCDPKIRSWNEASVNTRSVLPLDCHPVSQVTGYGQAKDVNITNSPGTAYDGTCRGTGGAFHTYSRGAGPDKQSYKADSRVSLIKSVQSWATTANETDATDCGHNYSDTDSAGFAVDVSDASTCAFTTPNMIKHHDSEDTGDREQKVDQQLETAAKHLPTEHLPLGVGDRLSVLWEVTSSYASTGYENQWYSCTVISIKGAVILLDYDKNGDFKSVLCKHTILSSCTDNHQCSGIFEEGGQEWKKVFIPTVTPPKVGDMVEVFWPGEGICYPARVISACSKQGTVGVVYDDGDEEEEFTWAMESWRFGYELHEVSTPMPSPKRARIEPGGGSLTTPTVESDAASNYGFPPGWTIEIRFRSSNKAHYDWHFTSPSGAKFRSRVKALASLQAASGSSAVEPAAEGTKRGRSPVPVRLEPALNKEAGTPDPGGAVKPSDFCGSKSELGGFDDQDYAVLMTEVEVVDVGKATAHAFQQSSSHYGTSQYIMHFEVQHQHQNVFWDKKVHEKKGSSASWATAPPNSFGTVRRWPRKKRFEHAHEAAQAYDELTTRAEAADKDDDAEEAERKLVVKSTKAKMEMYGWSQAKLGQTIKESQPIISRWLRGKENGELDVAAKVNERIVRKVKGLCHEIWSGQLQQVMDKKGEMGDETSEGGGGDDNGKIKKSIGWAALSPTPDDVAADEMGIDGGEEKREEQQENATRISKLGHSRRWPEQPADGARCNNSLWPNKYQAELVPSRTSLPKLVLLRGAPSGACSLGRRWWRYRRTPWLDHRAKSPFQ